METKIAQKARNRKGAKFKVEEYVMANSNLYLYAGDEFDRETIYIPKGAIGRICNITYDKTSAEYVYTFYYNKNIDSELNGESLKESCLERLGKRKLKFIKEKAKKELRAINFRRRKKLNLMRLLNTLS